MELIANYFAHIHARMKSGHNFPRLLYSCETIAPNAITIRFNLMKFAAIKNILAGIID